MSQNVPGPCSILKASLGSSFFSERQGSLEPQPSHHSRARLPAALAEIGLTPSGTALRNLCTLPAVRGGWGWGVGHDVYLVLATHCTY